MEHMHEHEHTHTHSHPHTHDGDHCHGHIHSEPEGTGSTHQTRVLLEYMIHHNGQHADELAKLGSEEYQAKAAEGIYDSIKQAFEEGY